METNLSISEFYTRLTNAEGAIAEAQVAKELVVLQAISVYLREGTLAEEAEKCGWSIGEAQAYSLAGRAFHLVATLGGKLTHDGDVKPSQFVELARKAINHEQGVSLFTRPCSIFEITAQNNGLVPTMGDLYAAIQASFPKSVPSTPESLTLDDLKSALLRLQGQTAKGRERTAASFTADIVEVIDGLYALAHADDLVSA